MGQDDKKLIVKCVLDLQKRLAKFLITWNGCQINYHFIKYILIYLLIIIVLIGGF